MQSPKVGIGVLIFQGNKLLLGKRKSSHGEGYWGPPGGHLEYGETFEHCAVREVQEETGLTITTPKLLTVTNDIFPNSHKHYVSVLLTAQYPYNQCVQNREPDKVESWGFFDLNALPDLLFLPLQNLLSKYHPQELIHKALDALIDV
ncbi:MAG: NUDIX domain-containing protein [Tatlockia sp.]|jgi:8-oxo-dGTP diphosphatase